MTIAANMALIRRYFEDVLDEGHVSLVEELFAPDCVVHRPELPKPLKAVGATVLSQPLTFFQCRDLHPT